MSVHSSDDSEYPYSSKPPTVLSAFRSTPRPPRKIPRRLTFARLRRLAVGAIAILALVMVPVTIVAYRARRQAAICQELTNHGLYYVHWHEFSDYRDRVPSFLRRWFGDDFWNDIGYINGHAETIEATNAFCEAFGQLPRLRGIGITSDSLTLDQLSQWPHFRRLEEVSLWSPHITDDDVLQMAKHRRLRELSIHSPLLTDASLTHIAALSELTSLELRSAKLSSGGLANALGFPHLTKLTIVDSPQLNDEALLNLGPIPELHEVEITNCQIGDRSLIHLASGGSLYSLQLSHTLVSDEGLAALSKCSQLSDLKLDGTKITDQSIAALAELPLSSISLENTSITDPSFQVLLGISSLRFLSLSNTRITGTGAISRETGEPVSVIDLNGCPLTHDGVTALAGAKYMSAIYDKTSLWLNRTPLTDNDLLLFADNDEIGHLGIAGTKITSAGLKALYTARKKRLQAAGTEEWLTVESDFPDIADRFLPNPAGLSPAEPPSNEDATATNPPQP